MGELDLSVKRLLDNYYPNHKDFWGSPSDLSIGTGLVYCEIAYPLFNLENKDFDTVQGVVLVLTHECDISQENNRYFNEELLICPIIPFEVVFDSYVKEVSLEKLNESFIPNLWNNSISRLMYLPPVNDELLPKGGLIYLNQVCSTHISEFKEKSPGCSITAIGLTRLSQKLQNHLLRPITQELPLTKAYYPGYHPEN